MECTVRKCTCKHEYQDKVYGQGLRLHNPMAAKGKQTGVKCTVCGTATKS
jgi:hypothetical protein